MGPGRAYARATLSSLHSAWGQQRERLWESLRNYAWVALSLSESLLPIWRICPISLDMCKLPPWKHKCVHIQCCIRWLCFFLLKKVPFGTPQMLKLKRRANASPPDTNLPSWLTVPSIKPKTSLQRERGVAYTKRICYQQSTLRKATSLVCFRDWVMRRPQEQNEKRTVGRMFNNASAQIHRLEALKHYGEN